MTDNEIIKALRFCSDPDTCSDDCSFYVEGETVHECTTKLSVAALDLIQRQQERIDRIVEQLEEELRLSEEEKRRCVAENAMQFDSAKGYYNGIDNAIAIVKGATNDR